LTYKRIYEQGEGSVGSGLCSPPRQAERWTQSLTVPVQCLRVELVVHQQPGTGVSCWAFEVADPHTKELLAKWVEPSYVNGAHLPLASFVTTSLRGVLLELTDPDPF
jgi:hypothetical protein